MNETLKKIALLYEDNLTKHGDRSKAVGWKNIESQELRFEKLTSVIQDEKTSITVNDYGCGYGAHLEYLLNNGFKVDVYNGYDLSDEMLKKAKNRLKNFTGELNFFQTTEINTVANYTFVSGTFNVRFSESDLDWQEFIKKKLMQISEHSTSGFSFNLLSSYVDWKDNNLFYAKPAFWFDFVKGALAKNVNLIHDYPLYEWTIVAKK